MAQTLILVDPPASTEQVVYVGTRFDLSDISPIHYMKYSTLNEARVITTQIPDTHALVLVPKTLIETYLIK